jgi:hypothetical protein
LEELLQMQHQGFAILGINADSYDVVVSVTSPFSRTLNDWWLNRKQQAAIPDTLDSLVTENPQDFLAA